MNRERLNTLLTIAQEIKAGTWMPSMEKDGASWWIDHNGLEHSFSINDWGCPIEDSDNPMCGFTACIIGHAALDRRCPWVAVANKDGDPHSMMLDFPLAGYGVEASRTLSELLDIDTDQTHHLFYPHRYNEVDTADVLDEAIRRLKEVLNES